MRRPMNVLLQDKLRQAKSPASEYEDGIELKYGIASLTVEARGETDNITAICGHYHHCFHCMVRRTSVRHLLSKSFLC